MKKYLTIIFVLGISVSALSQGYNSDLPRTKSRSVYFEILGNGLTYSLNYDQRFQNRLDGLGFKAGVSYLAIDGTSVSSIPFGLNYLLGKNGKYFELGLGATVLTGSDRTDVFPGDNERTRGSALIGNMILGYRSEPVKGGFLFRASVTPLFGYGVFWPLYGGLSVGYAF